MTKEKSAINREIRRPEAIANDLENMNKPSYGLNLQSEQKHFK